MIFWEVHYAIRQIFPSGACLKTLEKFIAWSIWLILALHLTGFLSQVIQMLEDVKFSIGKTSVDLLVIWSLQ